MASLFLVLATAVGTSAVVAAPASAGAVENLPGCTTNSLPANDDSSSALVPLGFNISFFGATYSGLYVNNNGNVSFNQAVRTYTPYDFTTGGQAMIAPFLADVDTTGAPANGGSVVTYGTGTREGNPAFCVNWVNVGYFDQHVDKKNSFQLILEQTNATSGAFKIVFNYDNISWETGDASGGTSGLGGTSAAAGWTAADGNTNDSYIQPGSFTNGVLLDSNPTSGLIHQRQAGPPGRLEFPISAIPPSGAGITGTVHNPPPGATAAPNSPVQVCGPTVNACTVHIADSNGVYHASGLTPGQYTLTAHPAGTDTSPSAPQTVNLGTTPVTGQDLTLGGAPTGPPTTVTITPTLANVDGALTSTVRSIDTIRFRNSAAVDCTGSYTITQGGHTLASGPFTPEPGANSPPFFDASAGPLRGVGGLVSVHFAFTCTDASHDQATDFQLYIDPSGTVTNSLGTPIPGASVVLLRSSTAGGPFIQVPAGSPLMSPANRSNPDATDANGEFGWDVLAGFYIVQASQSGCVSAADHSQPASQTAAFSVPPPADGIGLQLYCGESTSSPGLTGNPAPTGPLALPAALAKKPPIRCVIVRRFRIALVKARGAGIRSATLLLNGTKAKQVKVHGSRLPSPVIVLRGASVPAVVKVTVIERTTSGRTIRRVLRFSTCLAPRHPVKHKKHKHKKPKHKKRH